MEFRLYGREGDVLVEGFVNFKCIRCPLDQTYDDWPLVRRNFKRARRVWGRLGKLLIMEGADPKVAAILYRAVTQAVFLFGLEPWVLSTEM